MSNDDNKSSSLPLENATNSAWVSMDSSLLRRRLLREREERDWDGNEGREKSQQTNKSLSVRGWSDGMGLLAPWWTSLVGADTGYSCWFKKRGRTDGGARAGEPRVHRVAEWGKVRLVCMTVVRTAIDGLAHPLAQTALPDDNIV